MSDASQLKQLADEVLVADRLGNLVDERTLERLQACADVLGPPWVEPFMRDIESASCDRYGARLRSDENVPVELEWASLTLQRLALVYGDVPEWLSPQLTVLLLQKVSFGRGGGTAGAMSSENMRERLRDPRELAKWLRAQPGRLSRFSNELLALDEASAKSEVKFTPSTEPPDLVDKRFVPR